MTREYFIEWCDSYNDLYEFCNNTGCDVFDYIYSEDALDEDHDENLVDLARDNSWRELLSILNQWDSDSGYDFYQYDEYYGSYSPVELSDIKQQILEWADENDGFDSEDDEDEDSECPSDIDTSLETEEEECCSVMDMFEESRNYVQQFTERELEIIGESLRSVRAMVE